ncbi:MAG: hypothetical protein L0H55_13425, partial [Candidatus Nitrosocosmicus sp.]|nr:hypothetical protein [Candidatus Nitrosocosmicus sp.]
MNNDRIDSIISILKENENLNYLKLYKTLRKKIEPKLSYRDFTSDLRKLEEKGWIKKEDSGIRGTKGKYYIADFGILCCDNGISLKECDIYEKSIYFLLFVVGW